MNYKNNLSHLKSKQLAFLDRNIKEIDKELSEGNVPKAYYNLLLGAHTDDMKSFATTLLGREVEKTLASSRYKIHIANHHISFYTNEVNIKISLDPSILKITIIDSLNDIELIERANLHFSEFKNEGWSLIMLNSNDINKKMCPCYCCDK